MSQAPVFPASRELFELVRAVLDNLSQGERKSDAEIGRMIGLESARTSRWKHGQISVTDAPRLQALSQSTGTDISILSHVAAGYMSAKEALQVLRTPREFVRFLGEQIMLPIDGQALTLISSDGTEARILRRSAMRYERPFRRSTSSRKIMEESREAVVILADDDASTLEIFSNLTGKGTGIDGVVARSIPEALVMAGNLHPQMVIIDIYLGQADGFAAIRSLTACEATKGTEIVATSLSLTPEVARAAKGSGAAAVMERPLRSRPMGKLLRNLRRG